MKYQLTLARPGQPPEHRIAIGDGDALMDAAYDEGALGVTIHVWSAA
ncbi:MAG TPA: hypothetical protein VIM12_05745 [Noviherbaspirillum sp.]|jgi:hypothetical protein